MWCGLDKRAGWRWADPRRSGQSGREEKDRTQGREEQMGSVGEGSDERQMETPTISAAAVNGQ